MDKLTVNKKDIVFSDYERMIWDIVNSKSYAYKSFNGVDLHALRSELFSEGSLIFIKAVESWDKSCGTKFSTWLYTQTDYHIRNYLSRKVFPHVSVDKSDVYEEQGLISGDDEGAGREMTCDELETVNNIFEKGYEKWGFEKCAFLFYVTCYDETHEYNKYLYDFIINNWDEMAEIGFGISNIKNSERSEVITEAHIFFEDYFMKDRVKYKKLQNNVRNSIKYLLKVGA